MKKDEKGFSGVCVALNTKSNPQAAIIIIKKKLI